MIKLFWNTHNQKKINGIEDRDFICGKYHRENSDKWIYEILKKVQFKKIQNEDELQKNDTLLIIDSNVVSKADLYSKLKLTCSKIFLIHLGDETGLHNPSEIYRNCNYVWRSFCSNRYFDNNKVSCLPLGYKSGIVLNEKIKKREYKWSFIGTPHKSSRHDLLFQLSDIKPSYSFSTKKFNNDILGAKDMNNVLSSTEFLPCPNGFVHPETYRVYEALESGCIPIVENAFKYYDRLLPNNPFLKIDMWSGAKNIIQNWKQEQIKKQEECKMWWIKHKEKLQKTINEKISYER